MTEVPAALARLERLVGPLETRRLTTDTPQALLNDTAIPLPIIDPAKPSSNLLSSVSHWLKR
jgi:hypothetical protein